MRSSTDQRRQLRKFNPGTFQSDDEVIRQFVVRKREFRTVMDVIRRNADSPSCQHLLAVAPRGRGKTMLLARVAAELRTDAELSRQFLPVRFMEEGHEIFNSCDLWLEALFHLSRELRSLDLNLSNELQGVHASLVTGPQGDDLEGRARSMVLETADRLGRQLVLMIENLQALSRDADDEFGWQLRKVLQSEPQIVLLATATSRFRALDDAENAFFELFRIIGLEPLDSSECRQMWRMATGAEISAHAIRPLQILTGGDPRLLIIICEFARHLSLRALMDQLVQLIDDHTEYFRGHLEVLAKTERRVYLALVDLWRPSSTGEVAARARLDVRTVSTMLGRLVERGAVTVDGKGRRRFYSAEQRLYSIYYKLRRERDEATVVRNLIHFMAIFYSMNELQGMARRLTLEAKQSPEIREGLERVLAEEPELGRRMFGSELLNRSWTNERALLGIDGLTIGQNKPAEVWDRATGDDPAKSLRRRQKFPATIKSVPEDVKVAEELLSKAKGHLESGDSRAAISIYDELVARFGASGAPEVHAQVASGLLFKGFTYERLGNGEAAISIYDELAARFGDSDVPEVQTEVARSLLCKGITLELMNKAEVAIPIYDELVARFGASGAPEVQTEVARGLFFKGIAHRQLGNAKAASSTHDDLVAQFGDSSVPEVQTEVTKALLFKGFTQGKLGDSETAISIYDELAARYGDNAAPGVQQQVARALVDKGITLEGLGESRAAISAYDELLDRYGDSGTPEMLLQVAWALLFKGLTHGLLGESEAAISAYDGLLTRFSESGTPEIQEMVASALLHKGTKLGQLGDSRAEISTYHELAVRFGQSNDPKLRLLVTRSFAHRTEAELRLGCVKEAIKSCEGFESRVNCIGESENGAFRRWSLWLKVTVMLLLGRSSVAMKLFRSFIDLFGTSEESIVSEILERVPEAIIVGVSDGDLLAVLTCDKRLENKLSPLVVALRQRSGEEVRAPAEVLEVAKDIRREIEERVRSSQGQ